MGQVDAGTGLVHLGNGRFFSPALGRALQPHSAAAPPTIPQALNRYAATPVGQPGVYAAGGNWYDDLLMSYADLPVDIAALKTGMFVDSHFGLAAHLKSRTAHLVSSNNGLTRYAQNINAQGGVRVYGTDDYRPVNPHPRAETNSSRMRYLARDIDNGSLALSAPNRWQGAWNSTMNHKFTSVLGGEFTLADELVGGGAGFLFDTGWQIAQDWNDPFLTPSVKLIRGGVSGLVGLGSGLVVVAVVGTGLPGFVVAVGVGWIVETPISNWIYQKAGWVPTRDLRSLQNP